MSKMTDKMAEAGSGRPVLKEGSGTAPKKGDRFRCAQCGMEVQVTADCGCSDPALAHFHCCGQELQKA